MSLAPPDGWSVTSGVWGTNLDIDTSVYVTGLASLRLSYDATTAAPEIYSSWVPVTNTNNVPTGSAYYAPRVRVRASSIAAGNTVTIQFIQYQQDRTTVTNTNTIYSTVLNAANTWEEYGTPYVNAATNSAWGRFRLTKANNNFNAWFDEVFVSASPPFFRASGQNTALTDGVWTPIEFGSVIAQSLISLASNTNINIYQPGHYSIHAIPNIAGNNDGDLIQSQIYNATNGTQMALTALRTGAGLTTSVPVTALDSIGLTSTTGPFVTLQIRILIAGAGRTSSTATRVSIVGNK